MSKVKITNLKAGACVINSLKIIIPGMGFMIKDVSVLDDPDLIELESLKIISVVDIDEESTSDKNPTSSNVDSSKKSTQKTKALKNTKHTDKTTKKEIPSKKEIRPGTSFKIQEGMENEMGSKVVIVGDNGPEIKHMNPGINGNDGPKFVGDDSYDGETEEDGFTTI